VAEKLTGITRKMLAEQGLPATEVVKSFAADLSGKVLISDAPSFDQFWMRKLLDAVAPDLGFRILGAREVVLALADSHAPDLDDEGRVALILEAFERATETAPKTHRAADDVGHYIAAYADIMKQRWSRPEHGVTHAG
jgi:hypothetical protein